MFAELNDHTSELLKPFFTQTILFDLDNSGLKSDVNVPAANVAIYERRGSPEGPHKPQGHCATHAVVLV